MLSKELLEARLVRREAGEAEPQRLEPFRRQVAQAGDAVRGDLFMCESFWACVGGCVRYIVQCSMDHH